MESKSINGDEIRFLRTEMGYTPKELAEKLDIEEIMLKSMENGKTQINEAVDLKLRQLGFSILVVQNVMSTIDAKRKTRQITAIPSTRSINHTYKLENIA